jgi:glycosyltransferase involved in cell wall biosynthesis
MKIAFVYCHALENGGYPRDVRWLASALVKHGIDLTLFCNLGVQEEGLKELVKIDSIEHFWGEINEFDLVHLFGFFVPQHTSYLRKLDSYNKLTVISPLSHLMPYAMNVSTFKKKLFIKYLYRSIKKVRFHVLSPLEKKVVKKYFPDNNFFEASLGVFPSEVNLNEKSINVEDYRLNLIFFGRNDIYQKGIDILLESFRKVCSYHNNIHLTIAGQPWKDSEKYIQNHIVENGLQKNISIFKSVSEDQKWKLMNKADYLIYLSRFDGPPRPIREALAVGLPVIVTPETNMGHLVKEFKAGLQVTLNSENVATSINSIFKKSQLRESHIEGVKQLKNRLSWENVALEYIKGYESSLKSYKS